MVQLQPCVISIEIRKYNLQLKGRKLLSMNSGTDFSRYHLVVRQRLVSNLQSL